MNLELELTPELKPYGQLVYALAKFYDRELGRDQIVLHARALSDLPIQELWMNSLNDFYLIKIQGLTKIFLVLPLDRISKKLSDS